MKKYFLILLLFFLLCFTCTLSAQEILSIYFLDVGQGDSAVIVSPSEEVVLIDSGPDEKIILNYLQNLGISYIDLLIATHAHDDHITGMDKIVDKYKPRAFIDPGIPYVSNAYERLLDFIQKNKIKHLTNSAQKIEIGSMLFTILPTPYPAIEESNLNNNSVVVRLDFKDFSCLFTGDIEKEREGYLLLFSNKALDVDLLKVPNHGASESSSALFIESVKSKTAVICCGKDNSYKYPHPETINLLNNKGIKIYRTDLNGTILVKTDGINHQIFTEKEIASTLPLEKAETETTTAQEFKYAASRNSDVFHHINCSYVSSIKSNNLILFKTREEAIASGKRPCKKCNP